MLSPVRRTPLNSTASTVSSSTLLSASSSSSSPFQLTSKPKLKRNSGSSSAVIHSSQLPPFFSLLLATCLSYLMCQTLVSCAPSPATSHNFTDWKHNINSTRHSPKENLTNSSGTTTKDDMPQNDQPPRNLPTSQPFPESWKRQPQKRIYYLRADNDQFLQFNGYTVTGTKVSKPILGLVRFLSHDQYVVIVGFHEKRYLCMNANYTLYLSDHINHECYIQESTLIDKGSHATAYDFIKYKKNQKLYLGINCEPMLGIDTDLDMKATKFSRLDIKEEEAEAARIAIEKSGPDKHVQEKCRTPSQSRQDAKKKRHILRNRWCWNMDRIEADPVYYTRQCREREKNTCDKRNKSSGSGECVCDILERMISNTKRAKRKCLTEKLIKWVKKHNGTANLDAILEISRLLMNSYSAIARRMRTLKSKQSTSPKQGADTTQVNNVKHHEHSRKKTKPTHHTSKQHSQVSEKIQPCDKSSTKPEQGCRYSPAKLNSILENFKNELIHSSASSSLKDAPQRTVNKKGESSSSAKEQTEHSVLSKEFKTVLESLNNAQPKRHKAKKRKKKPKKSRRLKGSTTRPRKPKTTTNSDRDFKTPGTVSPG